MSLNTDESAVCRYGAPGVEFGLMANVFNVTGATAHSTQVTGLNDGSNNTFNVRCEDASGNNNTDDFLISFSIDAPDAEPPVASSISAVSDATAADVSWNTDEPSSSQVEYGLTDALGTFTSVDASLVASHSVTLVNLTPNTTYYYKVISQDGSGNSASAPAIPLAFTTAVQPSVLKQLDAYEDSFVNGFTYNEWQNPAGTPCLVAQSYTATSASGTASLATNLNNYCTLFLYRNAAFNVADYTHVEFDIYAVAPSLPGFSISLATQPWSTTGSSVQISSYVALGGSWQHVSIPLSAFAASGNIKGLYLRDGSSIGGNILFDNIRFVEKS
ncbi:fibronectin type III domain-containing protein [Candidatus Woesearchaeota archaeon]|nr:fibronectin type III domain-containing protein [Candidatus Woesearchaeota archaeon]